MLLIRQKSTLFILSFIILVLFSCKKDDVLIGNNDAPYYGGVPTVLVEFYVNRVFIDLIGREPFDEEMENEVAFLRKINVEIDSPFRFGNGNSETLTYSLRIQDNKKKWSNTITTPIITVNK